MAIMCEACKCSIYLEEQPDGTKKYGACENDCACCNGESMKALNELLAERVAQIIALTEEKRADLEETQDMGDSHPILHAEQGPNRFALMSLFFTDTDGVRIEEDLELNEITVTFFTDDEDLIVTDGALYEWATNYYRDNY